MCKKIALHILLVIACITVIPTHSKKEDNLPYCGPLKVRSSEYEACYDAISKLEVPCPNKSKEGTRILKKCRAPFSYSVGYKPKEILNVTHKCRGKDWWSPYENCQSDCGRPRANNKYPWLVAIYDASEELICTGSIISAYHVLTDRLCFHLDYVGTNQTITAHDMSNYTIIAGKHYSNIHRKRKTAQIRKVTKATAQSGYNTSSIILLEVDSEFDFSDDVQPVCIDWSNYYEQKDFSEGNEAVAVGWDYNNDEVVPCEGPHEFNVQFWHMDTCIENLPSDYNWFDAYIRDNFCVTYINGNQSSCGKSKGVGVYFKSSPWRYYLRGIIVDVFTEPEVTYVLFGTVSLVLRWLKEEMQLHPKFKQLYATKDMRFSKRKTGCKLPEHSKYGKFKLILGETYRVGAWVPTETIILQFCTADRNETPFSTRCKLGQWQPPIERLKCKRPGTCPALLSSTSEDVFCRFNGREVNCVEPENNTTAIVRCKPFHAISGNKPIYKCENGQWDQPFTRCALECGIKRVGISTLAIGESEIMKSEYPWLVGIYRSTEQICSGTIISRSHILSAAHCFMTSKGLVRNKNLYTIIAGKHSRNFSAEESSAQSRNIKLLHIHKDYKGSLGGHRDDMAVIELDTELTPAMEVQPVCVDWDNLYEDFDFIDGNNAVVAGWGYTKRGGSPNEVLQQLVLPYRSKDMCLAKLPEDFGHQYVATDNMCAGYENNNISVCAGDDGGGLYFKSIDNRFYVRGVSSRTAKVLTGMCTANSFTLYTKVSEYLPWMETITRRVL